MDIHYFATNRVNFLINFYEKALSPFIETMSLIERKEAPYEPEYSESEEPQFLIEWLEAKEATELLGLQCVSLLNSTLKLFMEQSLKGVFRRMPRRVTKNIKQEDSYKPEFKQGWFNGYKELFKSEFGIDFNGSSVNCIFIEELILARNRGQHPEDIVSIRSIYSEKDMQKISIPYFSDGSSHHGNLFPPIIRVSPEKMREAFKEAIYLVDWLENQIKEWGRANT